MNNVDVNLRFTVESENDKSVTLKPVLDTGLGTGGTTPQPQYQIGGELEITFANPQQAQAWRGVRELYAHVTPQREYMEAKQPIAAS